MQIISKLSCISFFFLSLLTVSHAEPSYPPKDTICQPSYTIYINRSLPSYSEPYSPTIDTLMQLFLNRLYYPLICSENSIGGSCTLTFRLDSTGRIIPINLSSDSDPYLSQSIGKAIGMTPENSKILRIPMPRKDDVLYGKTDRIFTLPITFAAPTLNHRNAPNEESFETAIPLPSDRQAHFQVFQTQVHPDSLPTWQLNHIRICYTQNETHLAWCDGIPDHLPAIHTQPTLMGIGFQPGFTQLQDKDSLKMLFTITAGGKIRNPEIIYGENPVIDSIFLDAIQKIQVHHPLYLQGKYLDSFNTIRIIFRRTDDFIYHSPQNARLFFRVAPNKGNSWESSETDTD